MRNKKHFPTLAFKTEENSNIVITVQAGGDLGFLCLEKAEINCHRRDTWY